MLGLDSTLIKSEYARFNNKSVDEYWQIKSLPGQIIFYCKSSKNKNKSNVAHVYDFNESGINIKYTTITNQEKVDYAIDYFNNLTINRKSIYKYQGVNDNNHGVWISNGELSELVNCNCGNVIVTLMEKLSAENELVENSLVKPGKSGELLAIVYTTYKRD